jgi:hypothetical protein
MLGSALSERLRQSSGLEVSSRLTRGCVDTSALGYHHCHQISTMETRMLTIKERVI